jgi:hypothetical protein
MPRQPSVLYLVFGFKAIQNALITKRKVATGNMLIDFKRNFPRNDNLFYKCK